MKHYYVYKKIFVQLKIKIFIFLLWVINYLYIRGRIEWSKQQLGRNLNWQKIEKIIDQFNILIKEEYLHTYYLTIICRGL